MKKTAAILLAAVFLTVFSSCKANERRYSVTYTDVFDTVTELTAYCADEAEFRSAAEAVHDELLRLHRLFDVYHTYEGLDNLKTVNDAAGKTAVPVGEDGDLARLISFGVAQYAATGGKLNIALGALTALWHECRETGVLPDDAALAAAAAHCSIEDVVLQGGTLYLADPQMRLDVGAIAKGYAAGRAMETARAHGLVDAALNIGGNTVASGKKPNGAWRVGVRDPAGGILTGVSVSDVSVVTSGDYERYVEIDGTRYHHIIDPVTHYPAAAYRAVTVVCADATAADALSTALFLMSVEEGTALLEPYGAAALWITADGTQIRSEGFARYE